MLGNKTESTVRHHPTYSDFDRLLDEIIKAEEDFTSEIRFFSQRLADTEARIHKSIAELMQMINDNGAQHKAYF